MNMIKATLTAALCAVAAIATFASAQAELTEAGKKAMAAAGKIMFEQRCASCHAVDPDRQGYGPSITGVIGRKAGSLEGFEYSEAMKNSGIVWTEDTLRAWIADNDGFMPGTRMRHVGISDKAEQDFIISYIKTLK